MVDMVVRSRTEDRARVTAALSMEAVADPLLTKHRSTVRVAPFLITTGIKANACRKNIATAITWSTTGAAMDCSRRRVVTSGSA